MMESQWRKEEEFLLSMMIRSCETL
jgi:hypothetical protein